MANILNAINQHFDTLNLDEKSREQRLIVLGSDDLDAVSKEGISKVVFDSHNDENIGKLMQFKFLKLSSINGKKKEE